MFDSGAIGTLIIGLEATRHDEERWAANPRPVRTQARGTSTRQRLAAALRGMAARIEPAGLPAR